jgi:hypothetical protein
MSKPTCLELRIKLAEIKTLKNDFDLELGRLERGRNREQIRKLKKGLEEKIRELKKDLAISPEQAREIMNREFFGIKEIEYAFDIKVDPERIPRIPFNEKELERAKELKQFLILRIDKTKDGQFLTVEKMKELLQGKTKDGNMALSSTDNGGRINKACWYKKEDFICKEPPKLSWALVSKEIIPNSIKKNYFDQTIEIVNYLRNEVFKGREIPSEFHVAIEEFEKNKDEIAELLVDDNNLEKATERLAKLAITKITRQTPVEVLYDMWVYYQNRGGRSGGRLLEGRYTWTSHARSRSFVLVGNFNYKGAQLYSYKPNFVDYSINASLSVGVSFSRRF